ncbi:MAG: hypothetical protein Q8J89_09575 [Caulobacter sp.]|nr:hypothetical protein [Caulobacter sp.]
MSTPFLFQISETDDEEHILQMVMGRDENAKISPSQTFGRFLQTNAEGAEMARWLGLLDVPESAHARAQDRSNKLTIGELIQRNVYGSSPEDGE